ncbi:MAG: Sec-independent protein translocase protein TatB [Rhodothalassiaceae bacterium]
MLDFHWTELIVVMIVTLLVVGPKDLPRVMRGFGAALNKVRSLGYEFRRGMEEIARESELEELRRQGNALKRMKPGDELRRMVEGDFPPDLPTGPKTSTGSKTIIDPDPTGDTRGQEKPSSSDPM